MFLPLIFPFILFLFLNKSTSSEVISYPGYENLNQTQKYSKLPTDPSSVYNSTNTCVTYGDLQNPAYGRYTDYFSNLNQWLMVFPENYCYGMLRYNISREDYANIVNKNLRKDKN